MSYKIEEQICLLTNDYIKYKNDKNKVLFDKNKIEIFKWFNLNLKLNKKKSCAIFCSFARLNDLDIIDYLLNDKRFDPRLENSAVLRQASLYNCDLIVEKILNDGRCTASDCGNNIIHGKINLKTFLHLFEHKTFNKKVFNSLAICDLASRDDPESTILLNYFLDNNLYLTLNLHYILLSAVKFNVLKNVLLIIKKTNVLCNINSNECIKHALENNFNEIAHKLFSMQEVQELLKKENKQTFMKLKIQMNHNNF